MDLEHICKLDMRVSQQNQQRQTDNLTVRKLSSIFLNVINSYFITACVTIKIVELHIRQYLKIKLLIM